MKELTISHKALVAGVASALAAEGRSTEADMDAMLASWAMVYSLSEDEIQLAKREILERISVEMDFGVALTAASFRPWLEQAYDTIEWTHWTTYKTWMLARQGMPGKVLDSMDKVTNSLLDLCGNPKEPGAWARRGLVVGDVQSGKTATYLALFNKAIDAGYRLIIVLAGGTEALRRQTQRRVDEGVIGRRSEENVRSSQLGRFDDVAVGIGQIQPGVANAQGMTTVAQDFLMASNRSTNSSVSEDSPVPYIFVVKKNSHVLNALESWLGKQIGGGGQLSLPVLVLDDESDYASVNTRTEANNPTAINVAIRNVLKRFSRSSYLAFTATPFANIFIDSEVEDDLFPRDYVYSLDPPSNYVGSNAVFGTIDQPDRQPVRSQADAFAWLPSKHRSTHEVGPLPASLLEAIETFFLANAVRDLRGDQQARSMLINVSRFRSVQRQVFELVSAESMALRNAIDMHSVRYLEGSADAHLDRLRRTFEKVYAEHIPEAWDEVVGALRNAVSRIDVQLHNSDRDKAMGYESPSDWAPRIIAVGGDVLSRGLTLEGLTVSYFHRNVGAYDTLMQMARWFGYRDGYRDLCRVWIDDGVADQYRFIQDAIDELRKDLRDMRSLGQTPKDFGLAVKKHPGSLLVTARNKMRSAAEAQKQISLAGRRIETSKLAADQSTVSRNHAALVSLMRQLGSYRPLPEADAGTSWCGVPKETIAQFMDVFEASPQEALFQPGALARYIRASTGRQLQEWDVAIINGDRRRGEPRQVPGAPQLSFIPARRRIVWDGETLRVSGDSARLAGRTDVASLLPRKVRSEVDKSFSDRQSSMPHDSNRKALKSPSEIEYYEKLKRPALMLYLLDTEHQIYSKHDPDTPLSAPSYPELLVGVKIAIPRRSVADASEDAVYMINKVAQQNWLAEYIGDEDEEGDDE